MTIAQLFGKTLQKIREEKGLSQERLAQSSGYHRTYISMLERGRKNANFRGNFQHSHRAWGFCLVYSSSNRTNAKCS